MDAYPVQYTAHQYPLIVLLGIDGDDSIDETPSGAGHLISSNLPAVADPRKNELLRDFLSHQGSTTDWSGKHMRVQNPIFGYKIKTAGRQYRLPARKEKDLAQATNEKETTSANAPKSLHSPLSPLTPSSPLYPDGIFDPAWIGKHEDEVPCLIIACYDLTSETSSNSLNDNKLKTDIGELRASLSKSGYKTRSSVILLGDASLSESTDVEERLANIRRGTGADAKTGLFYVPPSTSRTDVTNFVTSFILALQPSCMEYYRDLTKHARRKKSRANVPPPSVAPTDSSKPLPAYAWGIRYDVKQGVFAEFRQEMEAACRHYTSALEALMGSEGVFETTLSWTDRWNEGRILADMMAFRIIRCLLWSLMGTTATQSWINYRDRMRELVDRRGKGSNNYGWEGWESRWARIMAQLVQRAELQPFSIVDSLDLTISTTAARTGNTVYMIPEKALQPADQVAPWHRLHHQGYWFRLSARSARRRRKLAFDIPDEDRAPASQTPTSSPKQRSTTFDTYLAPKPQDEYPLPPTKGFDHVADITDKLAQAGVAFKDHQQSRFQHRVLLDIGRELLRNGSFQDAISLLHPVWKSCTWRHEKWWLPLFDLTRILRECAAAAKDVGLLAATTFELYSPHLRFQKELQLDLMTCGAGWTDVTQDQTLVQLSADSVTSFLKTSFAFHSHSTHVGAAAIAQLSIRSTADAATPAITLSKISAIFKDNRANFELAHDPQLPALTNAHHRAFVDLTKLGQVELHAGTSDSRVNHSANLTIASGQHIIFLAGLDVRDPGEISLESLVFHVDTTEFHLEYKVTPESFFEPNIWHLGQGSNKRSKRIGRVVPSKIEVTPKPPKLEISIKDATRPLYTDEIIVLEVEIENQEEERVAATIDVRLLSKETTTPEISWSALPDDAATTIHEKDGSDPSRTHSLHTLEPGASCVRTASFMGPAHPAELVFEAKFHYFLPSDPSVPLSKIYTTTLKIDSAFEANYDFAPRIHPAAWPSFFAVDTPVPGLVQRWHLTANLASFAAETLLVKDVGLELTSMPKGLQHEINMENKGEYEIEPRTMHAHAFTIDTTRIAAREHRQMTMYAHIRITWARKDASSTSVVSSIPVSPMILPPLEPRIVASATQATLSGSSVTEPDPPVLSSTTAQVPYTVLTLTLENPSQHPLTFDITAPSAESLAFSGPKQQGVGLLPYSRVDVQYRMLPLIRAGKWVTFGVQAVDRYFARDVSILAGEGLSTAEDGSLKWMVE